MVIKQVDYNKLVLDYFIYQGNQHMANLYARETGQRFYPSSFLALRSKVRDLILSGEPVAAKKALELYNFEFLTTTNLSDHLKKQFAIEKVAKGVHEEALEELKECKLELNDVLEMIVYGEGVDIERWRTCCAEIVNQVIVDEFGEIRNALVEIVEGLDWNTLDISEYYDSEERK
ncbi:LisH motif-containing protein [Trachipleistophora hominis]|uniref:LisH motif-containing protein n=1 Tax=Trachipleistophora hominis TaxID=72359 RepID=L7JYE9_TRAHO|nr:LisH motif-containing protein [Trachipleistophora hominis]